MIQINWCRSNYFEKYHNCSYCTRYTINQMANKQPPSTKQEQRIHRSINNYYTNIAAIYITDSNNNKLGTYKVETIPQIFNLTYDQLVNLTNNCKTYQQYNNVLYDLINGNQSKINIMHFIKRDIK